VIGCLVIRARSLGPTHSKHYDDFIDLWRNIQYHPMLWARADVEKNAEGTLMLTP
jgi:penicillin amidase